MKRFAKFTLPTRFGLLWLLILLSGNVRATHIVGTELYYECINPSANQYRVTLRMWRDCLTGEAPFDDPVYLFIWTSSGPMTYVEMPKPANTPTVPPGDWPNCTGTSYPLCVEVAEYTRIITLAPATGGHYLGWARCCRNGNITNLLNPLDQGVTLLAHIPGPQEAVCNSMPVWDNRMPVFICAGETFTFSHSATDPDGDSLVYALTHPYDGTNFFNLGAGNAQFGQPPPVVDPSNYIGRPPYRSVTYNGTGFSATNPFGGFATSIDPQTGFLSITPPNAGVYVIAISVYEYRNGVLLSENKLDFQVHVVNCVNPGPPPVITHDFSMLDTANGGISIAYGSNDTIYAVAGTPFCYQATVEDPVSTDPVNAFPVSALFSSGSPPASITVLDPGPNPVLVEVCWEPGCDLAGQTVSLIIGGEDPDDCENHNQVFDTVFIVILPPPVVNPIVSHDLSTAPSNGDTLIMEVDSVACFDWWVEDTSAVGQMGYNVSVQEIGGAGSYSPATTLISAADDSLHLRTCWEAGCDQIDRLFRIILIGHDNSDCPPSNSDADTVFVRILSVENPPPAVAHSLTGNTFNGDTIFVDVHDSLCYSFTVQDTAPGYGLSSGFQIQQVGGGFTGQQPVVTTSTVGGQIEGEVCWSPGCDHADGIFMLITEGIQTNRCNLDSSAYDTVYVVVSDPGNPPPIIGHTFQPGYDISGDTVFLTPDSALCYNFYLRDTVYRSYLSVSYHTALLSTGDTTGHNLNVTLTTVSDTLIEGEVCFVPGCDYANETLVIVLEGKDTLDCDTAKWVYDSVFVVVIEPYNNPPVITHNLGGLNVSNGEVQVIPVGEPYCYEVVLEDPDSLYADLTAEGVGEVFDIYFRYGNPAAISVTGTNPLYITVCWDPSCYDSGESFELIICGRDTSRCGLTPQVCDTVSFYVDDCTLEIPNVFTPNGDGINDEWLPFSMQGVEYFRVKIFDRWGKEVFAGENQAWNGLLNNSGNAVPEGVFYYVVEYMFYSARGVPLKDQKVGPLTLLR